MNKTTDTGFNEEQATIDYSAYTQFENRLTVVETNMQHVATKADIANLRAELKNDNFKTRMWMILGLVYLSFKDTETAKQLLSFITP